MKFTHQVKIGAIEITIEDTAESNTELWQKVAFWHSLPQVAPQGATDLRFEYRTPKDKSGNPVEYYSIVCPSERKEFKLGQKRKNAGQLFPKQWHQWIPGHQMDDEDELPQPEPQATTKQPSESVKQPESSNVLPINARSMTDDDLQKRAAIIVSQQGVRFADGKYTVQVNPRISYLVTKGPNDLPVCDCERYQAAIQNNPKFKCEHLRAVILFNNASPKPADSSELKLLIADLQQAGMSDDAIDAAIAKVCDGLFVIEELSAAQIAKALRTLQGKLTDLNLRARAEVA